MTNDPISTDPERWEALGRYLTGESTAEEAAAMRAWLAQDPARERAAEALGRTMGRVAFTPPADLDVEAALSRVKQRRTESGVVPLSRPAAQEPPTRRWTTTLFRIAAAVVLLLGTSLWWRASQTDRDTPSSAQAFATAIGQTDSLTLSDGTRVILAPASRLTIAVDYNEKDRLVRLDGEALFDVPHDDAKPFTVLAGLATIRDLGTTFTVRNDDAQQVRVAVTSGSVLLRAVSATPDTGVVLHAGERGLVTRTGKTSVMGGGIPEAALAWTRGTLVFDNATLSQVKLELKRWYGIELQLSDSALAQRTITATFDRVPIAQVLNVIALALGLNVDRSGDTAVIRR
ncbi:MAG: FecR domain-containing protein [Gemmatimonadota bacterium]